MKTNDTRQYEMLVRVQKFGEARKSVFPDATEGGRAFATVAAVVVELAAYSDSKSKMSDEGREAKERSREALRALLRAIRRTARIIARKSPGFADRFKMDTSSRPTDQGVLGAGRIFVDAAKPAKDQFLAHGMPETFVADLEQAVAAFDRAIGDRESGKEQEAVARKGMAAALASGRAAVGALDVIVANQLGGDRDAMSAWEHDRKVVVQRRQKAATKDAASPAATPAPALAPAAPVVVVPPVAAASPALIAAPVLPEAKAS